MAFQETTVYAAKCDRCQAVCDYNGEYCGFADLQQTVDLADGWATVDGELLCADCRPCDECGTRGGELDFDSGDGSGFLCEACANLDCATCGHPRVYHGRGLGCFVRPQCYLDCKQFVRPPRAVS